jgi:transcriptional regulator with GAF, ATPase, and Fis domain
LPDIKHGIDFYEAVSRFEIDLIEHALHETGGSQTKAARLLGLKVTTLHDKIKRYKIK